jgi:hypothetical protein
MGGLGDITVQRGIPGIGEFQCYDKYMLESLKKAAEEVNEEEWYGPINLIILPILMVSHCVSLQLGDVHIHVIITSWLLVTIGTRSRIYLEQDNSWHGTFSASHSRRLGGRMTALQALLMCSSRSVLLQCPSD